MAVRLHLETLMEGREPVRNDDAYLLAAREPGFIDGRVEIGFTKGGAIQ